MNPRHVARALALALLYLLTGCTASAVTGDPSLSRWSANAFLLLAVMALIVWDMRHREGP